MADDRGDTATTATGSERKRTERPEDMTREADSLAPEAQRPRISCDRCSDLRDLVERSYTIHHVVIPQLIASCSILDVIPLLPVIGEAFPLLDNCVSRVLVKECEEPRNALSVCINEGGLRCARKIAKDVPHDKFPGLMGALAVAAKYGHLPVLRWAVETPGLFFTCAMIVGDWSLLFENACSGGQIAVLDWLLSICPVNIRDDPSAYYHVLGLAAKNDRAAVIRWFCANIGVHASYAQNVLYLELEYVAFSGFSDTMRTLLTIKPADPAWYLSDEATELGARTVLGCCIAKDAPSSDTRLVLEMFPHAAQLIANPHSSVRQYVLQVIVITCEKTPSRPRTAHWLSKGAHIDKTEASGILGAAFIACCDACDPTFADWLIRKFELDPRRLCVARRIGDAVVRCCEANSPDTLDWLMRVVHINTTMLHRSVYDMTICDGAARGILKCCTNGYADMAVHVADVFGLPDTVAHSPDLDVNILSAFVQCCGRCNLDMATWLSERFALTRKYMSTICSALQAAGTANHFSMADWLATHFALTTKDVIDHGGSSMLEAALSKRNAEFAAWLERRFMFSTAPDMSDGFRQTLLLNALDSHDLRLCDWTVSTFSIRALGASETHEFCIIVGECCSTGRVSELEWLFETFNIASMPLGSLPRHLHSAVSAGLCASWLTGRADIMSYLLGRFYITAEQLFAMKRPIVVELPMPDDLEGGEYGDNHARDLKAFFKMMTSLHAGRAALLSMGWTFWRQFDTTSRLARSAIVREYDITEEDFEEFCKEDAERATNDDSDRVHQGEDTADEGGKTLKTLVQSVHEAFKEDIYDNE